MQARYAEPAAGVKRGGAPQTAFPATLDGALAKEGIMNQVAKVSEISSRSDKSFEDAIQAGIARASKTLRGVTSAWVKEQRVDLKDGRITGYQVNMLVTFLLDD